MQTTRDDATRAARCSRTRSKRIAFSVACASFVLLALEGVGRLAGLPRGSLRHLHSLAAMSPAEFERTLGMFPPGHRGHVAWPPALAFDVSIDARGFRAHGGPVPSDATTRILCLGDSTTFGLYVDDAASYPAQLQRSVPRIEVVNAGHPAWGTHDQLRFLIERGHRTRPQILLHLVCINDFADIAGDPDAERSNYAQKLARIAAGPSLRDRFWQRTALGEALTLAGVGLRTLRGRQQPVEVGEIQPISAAAWEDFATVYRRLVTYCTQRGITIVTACLPCIEVTPGSSVRILEAPVRELASSLGVPFVELDAAFRAAEREGHAMFLLPFDMHASPAGNRVIAREFERRLRELGRIE